MKLLQSLVAYILCLLPYWEEKEWQNAGLENTETRGKWKKQIMKEKNGIEKLQKAEERKILTWRDFIKREEEESEVVKVERVRQTLTKSP